ncbi:hypothetical protein [Streptosporangium sp. NPDC051022]|uniref:hypothetical protein n=1 Tax=Streptosporangium sp. NPDC051022 TaxID=3155752 RepID=UPI00343803D7
MMRKFGLLMSAAVVLTLAVPAAHADVAAADVPSCVKTRLDDRGYQDKLWVTNTCDYTVRAKVILAHETDLYCKTYEKGETHYWAWAWPGRFDGLGSC